LTISIKLSSFTSVSSISIIILVIIIVVIVVTVVVGVFVGAFIVVVKVISSLNDLLFGGLLDGLIVIPTEGERTFTT
jgi:uncharacterized membrane protein